MLNPFLTGCGIFFLSAIISSYLFPLYWVYIPALIDSISYPAPIPNYEIHWSSQHQSPSKTKKYDHPNIIVILADDLGYNDITIHGSGFADGRVHTPNIDSIGKFGAQFVNAYAGQATCAPSRASLLTGRFPTGIGYEFTPVTPAASYAISLLGYPNLPGIFHSNRRKDVNEEKMVLPPKFPTFAEIFQNDSLRLYRTLFLGKWHNGNDKDFKAITRGFDEKLAINIISSYLPTGHPESVDCILNDTLDRFLRANIRYQIEKNNGPYFEPKGYVTDYLGTEAVRAIEANKNDPFLMYLSFTAPHTPLQALRSDYESLEQFTDLDHCSKVYGSMLISLDRAVGKVLTALETFGLSENTLVIFSSDNGSPSYINLPTTNQPYRGWKASHFEGGIKVPLLMKWPKRIPSGVVLNDVVSHIDIFPTVANAAGIAHDSGAIDGKDLLPLIQHHQELHELELTLTNDTNSQVTCDGQGEDGLCEGTAAPTLQLTSPGHEFLFWRSGHVTTLRTKEWKIQVAGRPKKTWLYHLLNDPTERNNLANHPKFQADLDRMMAKLHFVNSTQSPPLWPALSETPVLIDKIGSEAYEMGDEFVYWPN